MTQYTPILRPGAGRLFMMQQAEHKATWPAKKLSKDGYSTFLTKTTPLPWSSQTLTKRVVLNSNIARQDHRSNSKTSLTNHQSQQGKTHKEIY